jgi:predicted MFS family arabinose efflux permease
LANSRGTVRGLGFYIWRHDSDTGDILRAPYRGIRLEPRTGFFAGKLGHARNHSGSLAAGFLLERYDTRSSMVAGAALTAGSLLFASQADSYLPFLISYFFAGFGVAMATLLPATLVVANWFQSKRGTAMGVAIAGVSVGGMIMVQVAAAVIQAGGWRATYTALALPVLLVVIPLVLLIVRTRPPEASVQGLSSEAGREDRVLAQDLEGLNLAEAIRTRSFWFIAVAGFLFHFTIYGILTQLVVYLLGVGYRPTVAAIVLSLTLGLNAMGKVLFGAVADRIGARLSLALSFSIIAGGIILLLGSRETVGLTIFLLVYGPAWGAPLMLIPLITMESHGDGMSHHTHPSVERRFNRAEAPVEVHHHETEHDPAMTKREHAARRAAHVQRR